MAFDHKKIEKEVQAKWECLNLYKTDLADETKEPYYLLCEFPYPSGDLHIGHWYAFSVTDIYARMLRLRGKNVLFPIGFDAFGLPAENAAIKHGLDPKEWTYSNMEHMRTQLKSMGASFDWSKEVAACDPNYYHWTQWLFTKLFEHGLAEHREASVKWCPKDMTVLANEQIVDGTCERCGTEVEEKRLTQWFFKITQYAERLLEGLDALPWREEIKEAQRAWIGRSEGAYLNFALTRPATVSEIAFASNNQGKLKRMQMLLDHAGLQVVLKTPEELGVNDFDVVEDGLTLAENSEKKAKTLAALTGLPVLADDSGFFIDGERIDPVMVKRNALEGVDEKTLTVEQVAEKMQKYYADIATKRGGRVDAEWRNNLCLVLPDKSIAHEETIRPVILTDESKGSVDPYLPLRGLYISKATGKYVLKQTPEEELIELKPISEGVRKLLSVQLGEKIRVFTTRPDTLFGATYVVLAPEHALVQALGDFVSNKEEVDAYVKATAAKTERERSENKEKTGVKLEGIMAVNSATKEEVPVYIADYVLGSYGTGAVMAVPAHDERDFEFAQKYNLPIKDIVMPVLPDVSNPHQPGKEVVFRKATINVVFDPKKKKYLILKWKKQPWITYVTGGVEEGEDLVESAKREIAEETGYTDIKFVRKLGGDAQAEFYAAHKGVNRVAHNSMLYFELLSDQRADIAEDEQAQHEVAWVSKAELLKTKIQHSEAQLILDRLFSGMDAYTGSGILINSGEFDGRWNEEAKWDIVALAGGEKATQYRLRDWSVSRQRYWGCPIPVVYDPEGKPHAIPAEHLPWLLPTDVDFKPTGNASPLASSQELKDRVAKIFGDGWTPEYDTLDTFVDSSWYFARYLDPKNDHQFSDPALMKKWLPVNRYSGGSEHTTMHLLYARFFTKALHDLALVDFDEPFIERFNRGLILGPDGAKMSKSKGNVINPDEFVQKFGADAVRIYLAFIGPYNEPGSYPWNLDGVTSMRKFLDRIERVAESAVAGETANGLMSTLAVASNKISADGDRFKFNTAVSALMIALNEFESAETVAIDAMKTYLILLAPFAPHLAEHLWEKLGGEGSVHQQSWPSLAVEVAAEVEVVVQVSGKKRGSIALSPEASEEEALARAKAIPAVVSVLGDAEPKRVVYVPGKILNLVV